MRIKKVTQTTPIQAEVVDSLNGNSTTNAPSVRAVNEGIENILNKLVGAFYNNDIVFDSDDTGEDIITAFSLCGLRK